MKNLLPICLLLSVHTSKAVLNCCSGENIISKDDHLCLKNKKPIIDLKCDSGILLPVYDNINDSGILLPVYDSINDHGFSMLPNGSMYISDTGTELSYCQTEEREVLENGGISLSKLYLVCYINDGNLFAEENRTIIDPILLYISLIFVILTIIVYAIVPKLLDLQGICIVHALVGMAVGYSFLGTMQLISLENVSCHMFAFVTYFAFEYMFFWLTTLSFHTWRITVNPSFSQRTTKWGLIYHVFAISGPLVLSVILLLAHFSDWSIWDDIKPNIGIMSCWFESIRETMFYFYGPISLLLICNVIFYVWTVVVLWTRIQNTQNKILKYRLKICIRLSIIMGITWIFELITATLKDRVSITGKIFFFFLDLFNILQGILIFLVLVVFRKRVRRALASKNPCNIKFPSSWKYLEDEEICSDEERTNKAIVEYTNGAIEISK
ncbi:G-protein coupled receptor Mth2-like [Sitophilus oryzae]|uniref:G-protein coupled receptor Mth2-like n=1 Tax=Sitophilus oryzae TaxID=7048 RepID=A0A6J2YL22_SITOR|nr:G-protein coupled receptor Mth2-like [Sitophilus oryzae]